jgi:hypothetical protein
MGRLSSESGIGFLTGEPHERSSSWSRWAGSRVAIFLAVALVASNCLWAGYNLAPKEFPPAPVIDMIDHKDKDHSQLPVAFRWNTFFSDDNKTISNPLWSALFLRMSFIHPFPSSPLVFFCPPPFFMVPLFLVSLHLCISRPLHLDLHPALFFETRRRWSSHSREKLG